MTNDAQLPMMKNMLNSAMKSGFPMSLFHCYLLSSDKEAATYSTPAFRQITIRKLEVILENMCQDSQVLWIDNDIVLFENCLADIMRYPGSFVMQDDLWGACTGFFLVRRSRNTLLTIQNSIEYLKLRPHGVENDQHAFNAVKKGVWGIFVTLLPQDEYPNGKVYFDDNRTSKARMVHSNYLAKTADKVQRFKDINLWDESDTAFELVNKYFI